MNSVGDKLYTRYPIVARRAWPTGCAWPTGSAFRPSASREQRYLAYKVISCSLNVLMMCLCLFSKMVWQCLFLVHLTWSMRLTLWLIRVVYKIPYCRAPCIQNTLSSRVALGLKAECVARAKVSCIQSRATLGL